MEQKSEECLEFVKPEILDDDFESRFKDIDSNKH